MLIGKCGAISTRALSCGSAWLNIACPYGVNMRTLIQAMLVLAATAALFACKPMEETPEPVAAAEEEMAPTEEVAAGAVDADARTEACEITITAAETVEVTTYWNKTGGAASQARSVHWATTAEKDAMPTNNPAAPLEIVC